jgi:hypothetical protein
LRDNLHVFSFNHVDRKIHQPTKKDSYQNKHRGNGGEMQLGKSRLRCLDQKQWQHAQRCERKQDQ